MSNPLRCAKRLYPRYLTLSFLAGCLLVSTQMQAQPQWDLDRILFEPAATSNADSPISGQETLRSVPTYASSPSVSFSSAVANPGPAGNPEDTLATVSRYLDEISLTERETSPFDTTLLEQYVGLGLSYQALEEHEDAIAAFEKAEYISRINHGLNAPEQFPIIERIIDSHMATGDLAAVRARQQYLLYMHRQHYGENSVETVPILTNIADQNLQTFHNALHAGNKTGFTISNGSSRNLTPRALAFMNLYQAQAQYYQAIRNLIDNRQFSLEQLMALEFKLIEVIFLGANRQGILDDPIFYMKRRNARTGSRINRDELHGTSDSFINGANAWSRLKVYQQVSSKSTTEAIMLTLLKEADWHRLFNRRKTAIDLYLQARDYLLEKQADNEAIEAIFNPPYPIQIPEFAPLPHGRRSLGIPENTQVNWDGYIDVSFTLNRYGSISNLEITGSSENTTRDLEHRLRRILRHSPFRPMLRDIEQKTRSTINMRYQFAQM